MIKKESDPVRSSSLLFGLALVATTALPGQAPSVEKVEPPTVSWLNVPSALLRKVTAAWAVTPTVAEVALATLAVTVDRDSVLVEIPRHSVVALEIAIA